MTDRRTTKSLLIFGLFSVVVIGSWIYGHFLALPARDNTWTTRGAELVSPDGAWKAYVDETVDEGEWPGFTDIYNMVHLVSLRGHDDAVTVLTVDYDGLEDDKPRIAWTSEDVLQITVPNQSYMTIHKHEYRGVRVDLRFNPDDPVAREARIKWLHEPAL